jgi:hypothetical protein
MLLILKSMKDCELKSKALLVRGINDNSDLAAPKVREFVLHAKGGTIRIEVSNCTPVGYYACFLCMMRESTL